MDQLLRELHRRFDHSALKAEVDAKAVRNLCEQALKYNFVGVCLNPVWVQVAADILRGSQTHIVATVGFPLGANRTDIKTLEAVKAVADGASELDMAANIGWILSGEFKKVESETAEVRKAIPFNVCLKVIIEAPLLDRNAQILATEAVISGGAQFVKSGSGFSGEVTTQQIRVLSEAAKGRIQVKAAGGIRTLKQCRELVEAGATRLGSSSSVKIMQELMSRKSA
jgi:deoxyribose-phosphate aldolase